MVVSLFHINSRIVDDLPAASVVSVNDDGSDYWFEDTHPIGYIDGTSHIYYNQVRMMGGHDV